MLTKRKDGRFTTTKTINGKRVFFYSTETTERKAQKDIENQMLQYIEKEELGKTINEVADEWEGKHYTTIKNQTIARYKTYVKRIVTEFDGRYIKEITSKDITNFLNRMSIEGLSLKTIRDQKSVFKLIIKYAIINNYLENNPIEYVITPKGKEKKTRNALTEEEIKKVQSDDHTLFGKMGMFLLYTGLRKGELLALTYDDLDFDNSIIKVTKSLEHIGNKPNVSTTKTEAGNRFVPFPNILKNIIDNDKHNPTDVLFHDQNGTYMARSYFRDNWIAYCKRIGIDAIPHQFRHTYATLLFEWDVSEKDAQTIMGHSDISITRNIYTHIRQNRLQETINNINNKINTK